MTGNFFKERKGVENVDKGRIQNHIKRLSFENIAVGDMETLVLQFRTFLFVW